MANLKITVEGALMDGHQVTFKAPCACTAIDKLDVRYIESGQQKSKLFTMKDTHGNILNGLGNLFDAGAYVHVILDTTTGSAYLQNGDTNGYLENKFSDKQDKLTVVTNTVNSVSVPNKAVTKIATKSLYTGTYLIFASATLQCDSGDSGKGMKLCITTTESFNNDVSDCTASVPSFNMTLNCWGTFEIYGDMAVNVMAYHECGGARTVSNIKINAIKIA